VLARESGVFRTTYAADMAVYQMPLARVGLVAFLVVLFGVVPALASEYALSVLNLVGIASIGAIGLNLLVGYAGQISLGQGGFMAIGAYTAALFALRLNAPFWVALPAAGAVTAVVGCVFGIPSLRVKGLYLAIATLAAQFIIEWNLLHSAWITGQGAQGALVIEPAAVGPLVLDSERRKYFFIMAVALLATIAARNLSRSYLGRAFVAIRDQDIAAETMGVNIFRYKLVAFAISSFYAGVTGAMWAYYTQVVSYEHFLINTSIDYLAMIIIGGLGSVPGSILGAAFITLMPAGIREGLDFVKGLGLPGTLGNFSYAREILFGLVIVLFLVFEPEGLYRMWRRTKDYFRLWPFAY
jgi:branched-chain amino acid transport system permease protein